MISIVIAYTGSFVLWFLIFGFLGRLITDRVPTVVNQFRSRQEADPRNAYISPIGIIALWIFAVGIFFILLGPELALKVSRSQGLSSESVFMFFVIGCATGYAHLVRALKR